MYVPFVLDKQTICNDMVTIQSGPVFDLITRELLTQTRICDELLGICSNPKYEVKEIDDFTARVLSTKPEAIINDDY
jgi:hypothetical protein